MIKVLIVGGGFAGIRCAQDLAKNNTDDVKITLVSDKTHFEYHAALYRIITGRSPMEVCIPLTEIFAGYDVDIIKDKIVNVDIYQKKAIGEYDSVYSYDYIVLALGSQSAYFNIQGLKENAYTCKSIRDALRLKKHLHETFTSIYQTKDQEGPLHFVVIGAGPSGVEIAGELSVYLKKLANMHKVDKSRIVIDLFEKGPQVLPGMSKQVSEKVEARLRRLGVNIYTNEEIVKEDIENIYLKYMQMKARTVLWTAGVRAHELYKKINGLDFDRTGRVAVSTNLSARGHNDVFIAGDSAATIDSGNATSATAHGVFIARQILLHIKTGDILKYQPVYPYSVIPVGPGWAAAAFDNFSVYGKIGWILRRYTDLRYFSSILPLNKAMQVFSEGKSICETCEICGNR